MRRAEGLSYRLEVGGEADEPDVPGPVADPIPREATASVNVNIMNLAITSVTPEGVVAWKGEGNPAIPITVGMVDDDFDDPVDVCVSFYRTDADNRPGVVRGF